jgi:hypothetical protein
MLIAEIYFRKKIYKWYNIYLKNYFICIDTPSSRKKSTKKIINIYNKFKKILNQHFENINQK